MKRKTYNNVLKAGKLIQAKGYSEKESLEIAVQKFDELASLKNGMSVEMLRDRDRLKRMAKIEYQEAKDLFSVGNMEFAIELQLANQHLGASREITRTLKNIGYEECKRMSEKEKQLLIAGIKQKLCGIGVIGVGVIFVSSGMPVVFIALSAIGSTLCVSKENVLTVCKNRLTLLTSGNKNAIR